MYAGESKQVAFRRGWVKALSAADMSCADIGKKVHFNTLATAERYLDPSRHLPQSEPSANLKRLHAQK